MTEVELILSSRPVTVETLNYTNSPTRISLNNLLTLKSNVVTLPKNDDDVFNILQKNSGTVGEKNFFKAYNLDKNGDIVLLKDGNKVRGRISKQLFHENKARQIFRKTYVSYPLIRIRG